MLSIMRSCLKSTKSRTLPLKKAWKDKKIIRGAIEAGYDLIHVDLQ